MALPRLIPANGVFAAGFGGANPGIAALVSPTQDALTDSGGGTADGTVSAMTAPGALTVTDGAGTNDGTIGAITDNASTITAVQELAAKANLANTMLGTVKDNFKEVTTELAKIKVDIAAIITAMKNANLMASS